MYALAIRKDDAMVYKLNEGIAWTLSVAQEHAEGR